MSLHTSTYTHVRASRAPALRTLAASEGKGGCTRDPGADARGEAELTMRSAVLQLACAAARSRPPRPDLPVLRNVAAIRNRIRNVETCSPSAVSPAMLVEDDEVKVRER
jgi:hypothetical protein